jgi:osmotically-inducible protein OsmY
MGKGKEVSTFYRDDEVKKRVVNFLHTSHFPVFRNFDVQVDSGEVTVRGRVDSFYEKQIAMTTCQNVAGVMAIVDQIDVSNECFNEIES